MLSKKARKNQIYDKLHRGFVKVCMAATVVGLVGLGFQVYTYFRFVRPVHKELQIKAEQELLAEGKSLDVAVAAS